MRTTFLVLLTAIIVLTSTSSYAARLIDRNYEQSRLKVDGCIVEEDHDRLGIYPTESSDKGFQANFHSEHDLFELLTKFYGCEILKAEGKKAYLISFNNRKEDGSIRTIMASLDLAIEDAIRMPSKMALYPSIASIKAIQGYEKILKDYGEENVFFQGVNVETFEYLGLFDTEGRILVDAGGYYDK